MPALGRCATRFYSLYIAKERLLVCYPRYLDLHSPSYQRTPSQLQDTHVYTRVTWVSARAPLAIVRIGHDCARGDGSPVGGHWVSRAGTLPRRKYPLACSRFILLFVFPPVTGLSGPFCLLWLPEVSWSCRTYNNVCTCFV